MIGRRKKGTPGREKCEIKLGKKGCVCVCVCVCVCGMYVELLWLEANIAIRDELGRYGESDSITKSCTKVQVFSVHKTTVYFLTGVQQ